MGNISGNDWQLLSAYSDGELEPTQARALKKRIGKEPYLAQELRKIQDVSTALNELRPVQTVQIPARGAGGVFKSPWCRVTAIAASFTAVAVIAMHLILTPAAVTSPTDWHRALLQQAHTGIAGKKIIPGLAKSSADIPDLVAGGLTLVAYNSQGDQARILHYAGLNGCRVTLAITKGEVPVINADTNLHMASWSISSNHFTLLASNMDTLRFAAISRHVRQFTEQKYSMPTVLAMRITTKKAAPCV